MSALLWVAVPVLGGVGALARFWVDAAVAARLGRRFPFGTLAINVSGAFALGLVVGLGLHGDQRLMVGTATLGSYTTFSTWMYETSRLSEDGRLVGAGANVVVSLAVGLAAIALGRLIGGAL